MPRAVLGIDRKSGTVTVPGTSARTKKTVFEEVRAALPEGFFVLMVHESIDTLDIASSYNN